MKQSTVFKKVIFASVVTLFVLARGGGLRAAATPASTSAPFNTFAKDKLRK